MILLSKATAARLVPQRLGDQIIGKEGPVERKPIVRWQPFHLSLNQIFAVAHKRYAGLVDGWYLKQQSRLRCGGLAGIDMRRREALSCLVVPWVFASFHHHRVQRS